MGQLSVVDLEIRRREDELAKTRDETARLEALYEKEVTARQNALMQITTEKRKLAAMEQDRDREKLRSGEQSRHAVQYSNAKPRNPRHFEAIGGGRKRVADVFIDRSRV